MNILHRKKHTSFMCEENSLYLTLSVTVEQKHTMGISNSVFHAGVIWMNAI